MSILLNQEISPDDIQRLYPDFAKNLLKFSILANEDHKIAACIKNNTAANVQSQPCEDPALDLKQETSSSKQDTDTPTVLKFEVKIQTESTEEMQTPQSEEIQEKLSPSKNNTTSNILEPPIETCDVGWNKKDNSGKLFQDQIDHMVSKEINIYEKEQIIKQLLPKETKIAVPPICGVNEDDYDGISFTSHYPQRMKKPEEDHFKTPNEYHQENRPLDVLFEEYANTLVERTIKHIAHGVLSDFLQQTSRMHNDNDQEDMHIFDDQQLSSIKGGALCAELFTYCLEHGIPFDDALVYKATEEVIWEFIKNKFPIFTRHEGEKEEEESNDKSEATNGLEREALCELVLRLLTSHTTSKETHVEREHASHNDDETYKEISTEKAPVVPKVVSSDSVPLEPVKKVILYGIETQTDTPEPQSIVPRSIQTDLFETQTIETQTFFDPKKEESSCQTSELKRSISEAQTDKLLTQTVHTETDTKKLLIEPHFGIGIPPKMHDAKNIQTSFVKPSMNKSCSASTSNTSQYTEETQTELSSSYIYVTETEEEGNNVQPPQPQLPKTKLFASVTENEIERMLKLQLLKRSLGVKKQTYPSVRKPYGSSDDSDTSFLSSEDSFIESSREERSISTFYTSESSRGLEEDFSQSAFEDVNDEHYYTSSTTLSQDSRTLTQNKNNNNLISDYSTGYISSTLTTSDDLIDHSWY